LVLLYINTGTKSKNINIKINEEEFRF